MKNNYFVFLCLFSVYIRLHWLGLLELRRVCTRFLLFSNFSLLFFWVYIFIIWHLFLLFQLSLLFVVFSVLTSVWLRVSFVPDFFSTWNYVLLYLYGCIFVVCEFFSSSMTLLKIWSLILTWGCFLIKYNFEYFVSLIQHGQEDEFYFCKQICNFLTTSLQIEFLLSVPTVWHFWIYSLWNVLSIFYFFWIFK